MMTRLIALVGFSFLAGSAWAADAMQVRLVWMDSYGLLRYGFDTMAAEVEAIFADAEIDVKWRKDRASGDAGVIEVVVNVTPAESTDWRLPSHTMGVVMEPGNPTETRVVFVFFNNVLRTLSLRYESSRLPTASETAELSRALARVVAHEVVHAICPEAPHTETGLMQYRLTQALLRGARDLRLSVTTRSALQARLLR